MKRFLLPVVALVAVLSLVGTGCGEATAYAAKVNDATIKQSSVDDELRQIRDNADYVKALQLTDIEGKGRSGTFNSGFAAQVVTLRIYYALVHDELAKRDVQITDADRTKARDEVAEQIGADPQSGAGGNAAVANGRKVLKGFSKDYQDLLVRRQAELDKLRPLLQKDASTGVTAAAVRAYYDQNKDQFEQVCAKHVLVDSKEKADAIKAQLVAGADFATVAKANSTDQSAQQNGGDLGCQPAGSYVDEFAQAVRTQPIGQIGDPVQTQFGFHVILVYDRKTQSFDEVQDQIRQQLQGSQADPLNDWLAKALDKADVFVNPRFGTFGTDGSSPVPRVLAPTAPSSSTSSPAPAQAPTSTTRQP